MLKNFLRLNRICIEIKGQALPYFLMTAMILLLSWAMMINIAKLLRDKMILQNSTDNAVLSVAVLQARTLNLLAAANYLTATILSTASYPMVAMFPTFSTETVGGSMIPGPFCDYKCAGSSGLKISENYDGVLRMKKAVNSIQKFQDLLLTAYFLNYTAVIKKVCAQDNNVIVVPSRFIKNLKSINFNITDPKVLLGIKRNTKGITYYKTVNYCIDYKFKHYHMVLPKKYAKDKFSWYVQDKDFYDKKLVALGIKRADAKSNRGYPLFSEIVNIKWPSLYAVSSAGVYNTKGPMFPGVESDRTGLSYLTAGVLAPMIVKQVKIFYDVSATISLIPVIGEIFGLTVLSAGAYYALESGRRIVCELDNKNTPVYQYNHSKSGGWDAHLVPLNN